MSLNQESENSVFADPASDKVAPDGTGIALGHIHHSFVNVFEFRCRAVGPLALPVQRRPQTQIQQSSEMDKNN